MALVRGLTWFFLFYFVLVYGGRALLHLLAVPALLRGLALRPFHEVPAAYSGFDPPVSVLVPAQDREAAICDAVRSFLALDYPEFEVVVVNDGSTDGTLAALQEAFQLEPFPEALWRRIPTQPVRTVYQSRTHANLRVVDKEPGGRADALNAGINASRYPLFCPADVATLLQRESLRRMVEPFLDDASTIATATPMRSADGCTIAAGQVQTVALPRGALALLQLVEALPTLLYRRLGWAALDAVVAMSGDFLLFRKDAVVEAQGFRIDSDCEDTELVVRLHRVLRARGDRYAVGLVPDPVAWTQTPQSLGLLARRRMRWQHGLAAGLARNTGLFTAHHPRAGLALPLALALECYGSVVELTGYVFMLAMYAMGLVSGAMLLAFLAVALALGFLVSASALLLEAMSSDLYPRFRQMALLVAVAFAENLGYRQLVTALRALALLARRRPRA